MNGGGEARLSVIADPPTTMVLAAASVGVGPICRDHLNGRLEHPLLLHGVVDAPSPIEPAVLPPVDLFAWWDFSLDIPTEAISIAARTVCTANW